MRPTLLLAALPVALLAVLAATRSDPLPVLPAAHASPPAAAAEIVRIQDHLAAVERELLARDVSHLPSRQRAARAEHIEVLREYRDAGRFPHNHDFPGERVPYFVDGHGTLCAMAYLISRSGRHDLVERVAATRNNAYVPELADDPELVAWLEEAGLSLEEAARIQPSYDGWGCCWVGPGPGQPQGLTPGYAVASALTSGVGGVSIGWNALSIQSREGSRWPGIFGIAAGAAGIALGVDRIDDVNGAAPLAAANLVIGTTALGFGTWSLVRSTGDRPDAAIDSRQAGAAINLSPLIGSDRGGELGVLLRVDF
jgi:hypothetical protein